MSASVAYEAYKEFKLLSQDLTGLPRPKPRPRPLVPPPIVKEPGLKSPPTPAQVWPRLRLTIPGILVSLTPQSSPLTPLCVLIIWSCPLPGFNPKFLFPLLV